MKTKLRGMFACICAVVIAVSGNGSKTGSAATPTTATAGETGVKVTTAAQGRASQIGSQLDTAD